MCVCVYVCVHTYPWVQLFFIVWKHNCPVNRRDSRADEQQSWSSFCGISAQVILQRTPWTTHTLWLLWGVFNCCKMWVKQLLHTSLFMTYNVFGAQPCLKQGSSHCPITIFVSIKIHHFKFLISFILVHYFNNLKLISRLSVLPMACIRFRLWENKFNRNITVKQLLL